MGGIASGSGELEKRPCVYVLASGIRGTLYVGVTSDVIKRMWEHKHDQAEGFTRKHGVHRLVWFELHADMNAAITREKQIKKWNRLWKIRLIEETNVEWKDLYDGLL